MADEWFEVRKGKKVPCKAPPLSAEQDRKMRAMEKERMKQEYCAATNERVTICPCHDHRVAREMAWDWSIGPYPFPCTCAECVDRWNDDFEDAIEEWGRQLRGE